MSVFRIASGALPLIAAALVLVSVPRPADAAPVGTGFTYQGQLRESGNPANGTYNMSFSLWTASVGGSQVGNTLSFPAVAVSDGVFTQTLDFGATAVDGEALWLQIVVNGTTLTPRQPLTAAPYAIQTRGIFTNQAGSFTGIGRKSPITASEVFGIRRNAPGFGGMYVETPDGGMPFYGYSTDGSIDAFHYYSDNASQWRLNVGGLDRMSADTTGGVFFQPDDANGMARIGPFVGFAYPGRLYVKQHQENVAVFNRTGNDGLVVIFQRDGSSKGSINVNGETVSYNAFTGSHYAATELEIEPGTLVRLTGSNTRLHNDPESEIVYGIEPTAVANDPACLGAYLSIEEPSRPGDIGNPHLVMAVGNGFMWIVENSAGDIAPGDYLISSDVAGCAMKDDPARFAIGHIVARAGERVNWSEVHADASGIRRAKVSVLFESFIRNSEAARLMELVEAQQRELDAMRQRLASIEEVHLRLAEIEGRLGADAAVQLVRQAEVNR